MLQAWQDRAQDAYLGVVFKKHWCISGVQKAVTKTLTMAFGRKLFKRDMWNAEIHRWNLHFRTGFDQNIDTEKGQQQQTKKKKEKKGGFSR